MKNNKASQQHGLRAILLTASIVTVGIAVTFTGARVQAAHDDVTPPPMPAKLEVSPLFKAVSVGHAIGTQDYICLPSGSSFAWALFTPQATLFNERERQLITHYFSPNPDENGTIRAAWQDSRDASTVWAQAVETSSDAPFVAPGAIPWVKLEVMGAQEGPRGGDNLTATKFIQRLSTAGGAAPTTGCAVATDIGKKAFMPYTADYFFYELIKGHHGYDN
jgi:hypothetical protein